MESATSGLGIARLLSYQVGEEVAAGRLKIVLEAYEEEPWPVHIPHRENRLGSTKVRTFIDMLARHLREHPHLA